MKSRSTSWNLSFIHCPNYLILDWANTAQNMKFSINGFFSKCDQIRRFLRIWSHSLKKSLMENFIFCAVKFCAITNQINYMRFSFYYSHLLMLWSSLSYRKLPPIFYTTFHQSKMILLLFFILLFFFIFSCFCWWPWYRHYILLNFFYMLSVAYIC